MSFRPGDYSPGDYTSTSTSHKVFIEPYCIFCQEATSHVETRSFTKIDTHSWTPKKEGFWDEQVTYTQTTTQFFSSPFPAHPECLRAFEKGRHRGLLIGVAMPTVTFLILVVMHLSRILTFSFLQVIIGMIALAAGIAYWSVKNRQVTDALERKVRFYYNRHVQADIPAFSSTTGELPKVVSVPKDYKNIQMAIAEVPVGSSIFVGPGTYGYTQTVLSSEGLGLVINKPVEIIGVGQVVIEDGIRIQTPDVKIKGLTIKKGYSSGPFSAVEVVFGKVLIEDCHILWSNENEATIFISGPMSEATIRRCSILASQSGCDGIYVTNRGSCVAEDCDVSGESKFSSSGVVTTSKETSLTLRRCKVHHLRDFGINLSNCRAVLEDCLISGNGYSGVIIGSKVDLSIQDCQVFQNKQRGVLIGMTDATPSNVNMEKCDVFDNGGNGIEIWRGNNPTIRNCRIHDGKKAGICIYENSQGLIEECDVFSNALAGIEISESSNPAIRNCQLHDGKQGGFFIYSNGKGVIEDCDVFGNGLAGIEISTGGNPMIRRCLIHNGETVGFRINDDGKGVIENCEVYENALDGIYIGKGSNPVIQLCKIKRNGAWGVELKEMSTAIVEECNLTDNVKGACQIASDCQVHQKGNTFA